MRHPPLSVLLPLAAVLAACGDGAADNAAAPDATSSNAPTPAAAAAADANAAAPADSGPTANWHLPMRAAQLSGAERDAIFRAAGLHKRGGHWDASDEPGNSPADSCPAEIADPSVDEGPAIRDLDGDGRPEVIVTSTGMACHGMSGVGFAILTPTQTGWRRLFEASGSPLFRRRAGSAWPDLIVGGPGTCFPRYRWNGRDYRPAGGDDGEGHACTIPGMEDETPAAAPPRQAARPIGPLGLAAGYFVEEASRCDRPSGMIYYYDGRRYAVIFPSTPDTTLSPVGRPQREHGRWQMDDGSQVEVLSPTRMRFTYEETGPPMRLCPTEEIPARLRVR